MRVWEILESASDRRMRLDRARQKRSAALASYQETMRTLGSASKDVGTRRAAAASKYQDALKVARDAEILASK